MKSLGLLSAAIIAVGLLAPASAAEQKKGGADRGLEIEFSSKHAAVRDCHADVRRHYLDAYGRQVWHRHRQSNCRVVLADRPGDDDRPRDCHRDVRRHYLRDYGRNVTHRHVGPNCRVRVYNQYNDGRPHGGNCIKIGPITYCEN